MIKKQKMQHKLLFFQINILTTCMQNAKALAFFHYYSTSKEHYYNMIKLNSYNKKQRFAIIYYISKNPSTTSSATEAMKDLLSLFLTEQFARISP